MMNVRHIETRLKWVPRLLGKGEIFWNKVIFNDEKKLILDGPDGLPSYWNDLCTQERVILKRQNGSISVMVWGAMWPSGLSSFVFRRQARFEKVL